MHPFGLFGAGVGLFATTNIDDIFVLLGFFSDPTFRGRHVVVGQYAGILALLVLGLLGAAVAGLLPPAALGLLGLFPLALGLRKLVALRRAGAEAEGGPRIGAAHANVLSVAAVTVANGGDNLSVYVPLFARMPHAATAALCAVFLGMTGVWCVGARALVRHPSLGKALRAWGHVLLPWVYIGLGAYILLKSGPLAAAFLRAR